MKKLIHKIKKALIKSSFYSFIILNKKILICHALMLILFLIFKAINFFNTATFFSVFIPALVSLVITLKDSKEYSTNLKIMSICYDHMGQEEGVSIDDVLGILISNKYRQKLKRPIYSFFDILEIKCQNGNVEEKRRIAEAIPMLYHIDRNGTKKLTEILRNDYDDIYHDDNRRRAIEALKYYNKVDASFIKKMLVIREGDSVYTVIAIIEIILFTNVIKSKNKESELKKLNSNLQINHFTEDQKKFFEEVITFFTTIQELTSYNQIETLQQYYTKMFFNSKFYMRILIAKNMISICPFHEQCRKKNACLNNHSKKIIIDFFDLCLKNEKNVRRPMAKEDVCYCLLRMMKFPEFRDAAKERIIRLIKDNDQIISTTSFDYIYDIYDTDIKLYKEIMNYCLSLPDSNPLKTRATHVMKNITIMPKNNLI